MKGKMKPPLMTVALAALLAVACEGTRKGPYLTTAGGPTEMTIRWQLCRTETCLLEWGREGGPSLGRVLTEEEGNGLDDHRHAYTITGLDPASTYWYRVGTDGGEYGGTFRTGEAADATSLKFLVYGDTLLDLEAHDRVAAAILDTVEEDPGFRTFLLDVGDMVLLGDSEAFWDLQFFNPTYANIRRMLAEIPLVPCRGNHEASGALFRKYFPYPYEPGGFYRSFDSGPAHFCIVDVYADLSPGSAELEWLDEDLRSTDKPWKFLLLHEPGWSAGGHPNNVTVQQSVQPLCTEWGVDMVLAGHNHYYARAEVDGVVHVTTGGGGSPLYDPTPGYTPEVVVTAKCHHFCKVEIDGAILSFSAVRLDGVVIDAFRIEK